MTLLAFHGRPHVKKALLTKLAEHKKLDEIRQGSYHTQYATKTGSVRFRGCAVGCTVFELTTAPGAIIWPVHPLYERFYGIPLRLALLEDALFETLPEKSSAIKTWPIDFIEAITPGACLDNAGDEILKTLIRRENFKKAIYACATDGDIFYREIEKTKDVVATLADWPMRVFRTDRDSYSHALANLKYTTYFPDTVLAIARIAFRKTSDSACAKDVAKIVLSVLREQKPRKKKLSIAEICRSVVHTGTTAGMFSEIPERYRPVTTEQYFNHLYRLDD